MTRTIHASKQEELEQAKELVARLQEQVMQAKQYVEEAQETVQNVERRLEIVDVDDDQENQIPTNAGVPLAPTHPFGGSGGDDDERSPSRTSTTLELIETGRFMNGSTAAVHRSHMRLLRRLEQKIKRRQKRERDTHDAGSE